ncbi:transposase [Micromonospora sp. 4G53]|uniref:Transposase n=1 Tax=Micromonospora sicca TaxID=2202420 RepID=A0ABU5JEU6_9ACTN|nr:transposase [Micromonospora sp. 4G53]MDZ5490979.1 transposase [Micromonospora sp. 4G53]
MGACGHHREVHLVWVHPKRGRDGIDAGQVMGSMTGIAVHDAWAPYDTYTPAGHQLCCAHLLRELTAAAELAPRAVWPCRRPTRSCGSRPQRTPPVPTR